MSILDGIANSSNRAAEGYFRNVQNADAREANAFNRRRVEEGDRIDKENMMITRSQQNEQVKMQRFSEAAKIAVTDPDAAMQFLGQWGEQPAPEVREMLIAYGQATFQTQQEPSAIQEHRYFQSLSPAEQESYLLTRRGGNVVEVGGGGRVYRTPDGSMQQIVAPEIATGRDAARQGALTEATQAAQTAAIPARTDVEIQSEAQKGAATRAQTAASELPKIRDIATSSINALDSLINDDALQYVTGIYSMAPVVPGTPQARADAALKQIEGKAFLEAFEGLKGGGQITQVEGEKATQAIARLSRRQSTEDMIGALTELKGIIENGLKRANRSAMGANVESLQNNLGAKLSTSVDLPVGTVDGGYVYKGGDPSLPESWEQQ